MAGSATTTIIIIIIIIIVIINHHMMMMMTMTMSRSSQNMVGSGTTHALPGAGVGQTLPNVVPQKYHCNDHDHHHDGHDDHEDDDDDDLLRWSCWP